MPEWLRGVCVIVLLICVASATGTFLAVQFGHPRLPWQENANPPDHNPGSQQGGAEKPPLIGERYTGSGAESDAKNIEEERREQAANERGLTEYTGHLAIFTLLLVFVAFTQAGLFVWQLALMREGVDDAKVLAKSASLSAKTAETALTNVQRPWLFAESVRALPVDEHPQSNNRWTISFGFKNIGQMPAINEECIIKIIDKDKAPPIPDYTGGTLVHVPAIIAVDGEFKTQGVGPADGRPNVRLVLGRLTYKELNGKSHKVGFAVDVAPIGVLTSYYPVDAYHYYD
jgi:hypothetical protein